jgi:hypothetical protein
VFPENTERAYGQKLNEPYPRNGEAPDVPVRVRSVVSGVECNPNQTGLGGTNESAETKHSSGSGGITAAPAYHRKGENYG